MIPISYSVTLSAILFSIGIIGVLIRRNILIVLMSVELMINAVNLNLIAFSTYLQSLKGIMFVFFIIAVEAAELAVALAIIIICYRNKETTDLEKFNILKW